MKILFIMIGLLSFALGAVGVVLPVLPTTPFLLLAGFCFAKGSDRFHRWFLGTSLYKKHLESFVDDRSMTRKSKICILAFASSMLLLAFYFCGNLHARIAILVVMVVKYYYFLFKIKTKEA